VKRHKYIEGKKGEPRKEMPSKESEEVAKMRMALEIYAHHSSWGDYPERQQYGTVISLCHKKGWCLAEAALRKGSDISDFKAFHKMNVEGSDGEEE